MKIFNKSFLFCVLVFLGACSGGGGGGGGGGGIVDIVLQSISIDGVTTSYVEGTQEDLSLLGSFNNGSQSPITAGITWSSSDTSVVTVSSAGVLNAIAPGTAEITAAASGFSATATITVEAASLTEIIISASQTSIPLGVELSLSANGTFNNNITSVLDQITWSSSDESVATISSDGIVSGVSTGSVSMTATQDGISASFTLTISSAGLVSINIQATELSIVDGNTTQATATGIFTDASSSAIDAQWVSSDDSIASVDENGLITGESTGQVQITASLGDISSNALTIDVSDALVIGLSDLANLSLALGQDAQVTATLLFSNDTTQVASEATWTSSDTSIVAIDVTDGVASLSANMIGSATIEASASSFTTSFTVIVSDAVIESIAFNEDDISLPIGVSQSLSLIANFTDDTTSLVTNNASFSVDPEGLVNIGTASNDQVEITAATVGTGVLTGQFMGLMASADINVNDAVATGIVIDGEENVDMPLGLTQEFSFLVEYSNESQLAQDTGVTWSSSDESIASVSADGSSNADVTAVSQGNVDITANFLDFTITFNVTVSDAEASSLSVTLPEVFLDDLEKSAQAVLTFTDNTSTPANDLVVWSSADTSIATVSNTAGEEGLISPVSEGSTTVSASFNGGELIETASLDVQAARIVSGFELHNYDDFPTFVMGSGDAQTTVQFSVDTETSITVQTITGSEIALSTGTSAFDEISDASSASFVTSSITLEQNSNESIAIIKNENGFYAMIQVHDVRVSGVDATIDQVSFSWALRVDGGSTFADYQVQDEIKLLRCSNSGCSESSLPRFTSVEQNSVQQPQPAQFELAEYTLISIGKDFTVTNLSATESNGVSTLSFDGIENNQVIPVGHGIPFTLLSTPTNSDEASLNYVFDIDDDDGLLFTYTGTFTSN